MTEQQVYRLDLTPQELAMVACCLSTGVFLAAGRAVETAECLRLVQLANDEFRAALVSAQLKVAALLQVADVPLAGEAS